MSKQVVDQTQLLKLVREKLVKARNHCNALETTVQKQQEIIINQQKKFVEFKNDMRDQINALRKEMLVQSIPNISDKEMVRKLKEYLLQIRSEIVELQKREEKWTNFQNTVSNNVQSSVSKSQLLSFKKDVISIKKALLNKDKELERQKKQIENKLKELRKEVDRRENSTNNNSDNKIPENLKVILVERLKILRENTFKLETENNRLINLHKDNDFLSRRLSYDYNINILDMHTGGEPLRIIESGLPILKGSTLLEKRQYMKNNFDIYRQFLMYEPRGHFDMYGAIITESDDKNANFGVIFMHNEGYSSNCGHAILALARYAVDIKKIGINNNNNFSGEVNIKIQTPSGIVNVTTRVKNGVSLPKTKFLSSPGWVDTAKCKVEMEQYGRIEFDLCYGGAYYAILPAKRFGLDVKKSNVNDLINIGNVLTQSIKKQISLKNKNPDSRDLEFVYGTILTDGNNDNISTPTHNICIFADRQVDRCPTGSGVIARCALDFQLGLLKINQPRRFISRVGSEFIGTVIRSRDYKNIKNAVEVQVEGEAYYTGRSSYYLEKGDQLGRGFVVM